MKSKYKFYAVAKGRETGIFDTGWDTVEDYVYKFTGCKYAGFNDRKKAEDFMEANGCDKHGNMLHISLEIDPNISAVTGTTFIGGTDGTRINTNSGVLQNLCSARKDEVSFPGTMDYVREGIQNMDGIDVAVMDLKGTKPDIGYAPELELNATDIQFVVENSRRLSSDHKILIKGHNIKFPNGKKPFAAQICVINKAIEALNGGDNALLESPTGTGIYM